MQIIFVFLFLVYGVSSLAYGEDRVLSSQEKLISVQQTLSVKEALLRGLEAEKQELASRVDMMKKELSLAQHRTIQTSERLGLLEKEKDSWQYKTDMLVGEKIALRQSLKVVADELEALKRDRDQAALGVQKQLDALGGAAKTIESELRLRLSNEQSKVQEKIVAVKKPLDEKIIVLEKSLKAKELMCLEQIEGAKATVEEKVRQREEQIAILRESAGREIKKAQAAAAQDVQKIQDQLTACRAEKK